ncbi:hypothetical protein DH09_08160 [Bacillaceae bacterium JMAK1]|nr:hypothetical protein DH09_08160 [Bacillaceae bacterium JMAK1]
MSKSEKELLSYIPPHTHDDLLKAIFKASGIRLDELISNLEDTQKQSNLDTATWGLAIYEEIFNLSSAGSIETRRRRVQVARDAQNLTPWSLQELLNRYMTDGSATVKRVPESYRIEAILNLDGLTSLNDLIDAVLEVIPANQIFRPHLVDGVQTGLLKRYKHRQKMLFTLYYTGGRPVLLNGLHHLNGKWLLNGLYGERRRWANQSLFFISKTNKKQVDAPLRLVTRSITDKRIVAKPFKQKIVTDNVPAIKLSNHLSFTNINEVKKKEIVRKRQDYWQLDGVYRLDGTRTLSAIEEVVEI